MYAKKIVFSAFTAPVLGKFLLTPLLHSLTLSPLLQCSCTSQLNTRTVVAKRRKRKLPAAKNS